MKLLSLFGLLVIVAHSVSGHGDGAPCSIHDSMRPSSTYHGPDKNDISSAPFEVLVLDSSTKEAAACYKPGVNYIVRVQPKSSSNSFRGFLIQSRDSSDKAVGKFDISGDAASKMRYQCKDKTDSVTHKDSDDKSKIDAVWNSDSEHGVLIFKATVVEKQINYYVQIPSKPIDLCK